MTALILRAIEKYQPKPEIFGIVSCLAASFGRFLIESRFLVEGRLSPYPMWSGLDFGRLSAATHSTSDNQEHEPRNTRVARFALSHPIGILQMG